MNKKKIIILGATGFLGSHLCKSLIENGYHLVVFIRSKKNSRINQLNSKKITLVCTGDLTKIKKIDYQFSGIECVINCAARAHVLNKEKHLENKYIDKLINIERNIIRNIKNKNIRIIHISTSKIINIKKNKNHKTTDLYTRAKLESEKLIKENFKNYIILRPPLIYGPEVKANFLFLMNIINWNIPLPFYKLNNARSYIYLENFLDIILKIISNKKIRNKTYNVSDGQAVSTYILCKLISKHLSKKTKFFYVNKKILNFFFKLIGKDDILEKVLGDFIVDSKEIEKDLNWKPKYKIEEGIKKTCFWYKRRFNISK